MKKATILVCAIILTCFSHSQTIRKVRKVFQVMPEQTFYLNGGNLALVGGKSRTYYQIILPKNTVEWYYTFSTTEGQTPNKTSLNLVAQLTKLFDPSGTAAIITSAIMMPTGSNSCDIYLMDRPNADAFLKKVDKTGGKYYYTISGSRENFRDGIVQIKDAVFGTYYLGFKNPSASTGITIAFEVAAIVEEVEINNTEWSNETKERLYRSFYQNIRQKNADEDVTKDLANCLLEKITAQKNPAQYDGMIQSEREAFVSELYAICLEKYKEQKTPEQEKATNYGNLGWRSYENGDIDKCIEYSKKALSLDNTLGWVKSNLGLCYLIKGADSTATDYYIESLSDIKRMKLKSQIRYYLQATIEDIDNAQTKYSALNGSLDIKALFSGELKNY